ncbi:MAG: tRNA epoxyqueuosine(34) reductase QueG [Bacteroidales bacterium]|nr:tRNA epoxyqueuosine(34) reductase QueG [Bacteroidales bacterium]
MQKKEISEKIRGLALDLGFTACGFAPAAPLAEDAGRLRQWIDKGMHAGMGYMENHFEKRTHPASLVEGAKSVIVVLLNYYPEVPLPEEDRLVISKYARGRDYHKIMKTLLKKLHTLINAEVMPMQGRAFADSAPVLERALAREAGLGWIGKNGNLIVPKAGSYFFIGELIVDAELEYGSPIPDRCGDCTRCIEACPTGAIITPGVVDSRRCISYWTIEHSGPIDPTLKGKFNGRIFGCDICQDVCPWNRKSIATSISGFRPSAALIALAERNWEGITEEEFGEVFNGTAVKRTKYEGFLRNIRFLSADESPE